MTVTVSAVEPTAMIVIEDLKVGNMSRSAKGTTENPGTNVAAKSELNWSILYLITHVNQPRCRHFGIY